MQKELALAIEAARSGGAIIRSYYASDFSLSPKNEWDICAGTMLVEESGGVVTSRYGEPLTFNNANTLVPGLIAAGPALWGPLRDAIRQKSAR